MNPDNFCEKSSANWWRQRIESFYQQFLHGDKIEIYWHFYDVLVEDNFMEADFYIGEFQRLQMEFPKNGEGENGRIAMRRSVLFLFNEAKRNRLPHLYKITSV